MEKPITVKELNETIKNNRKLLEDLRAERERLKIGFLNGETPRLMQLLTDTIDLIERLNGDLIAGRRELKRRLREKSKLEEPKTKPTPLIGKEPTRDKIKRKLFGSKTTPSRKHLLN